MTAANDFPRRAGISDVLRLVDEALNDLGARHSLRDVERLGTLVHEAMSLESRHYHDVGHAVSVAEEGDGVEKLAALFHDVVYHHVDGGFAPKLAPLVEPFVAAEDGGLELAGDACGRDRWASISLAVFGASSGERLRPEAGQNELLSAIVAARALAGLLPETELVQIVACIEATIPFRRRGEDGSGPTERLGRRLRRASEQFALGLDPAAAERCLTRTVNVSNRDVASFAREDITHFLAETWQLFAESNPLLARKRGFLISDYRRSLVGALGFFSQLDPEVVFRTYRGTPGAAAVQRLTARARENLERGAVYLKMKLIGIALVEALARLTGGDTLVAIFMGQVRYGDEYGERLEDHLPGRAGAAPDPAGTSSPLYRLLAEGRAAAGSRFDMPNSPITAYLHDRLGEAGVLALYEPAAAMVADAITPETFLKHVRADVLHDVAQACKAIAWTRTAELDRVLSALDAVSPSGMRRGS